MLLILPFPPSINHYWRHCRGMTFISKEGQLFRSHVAVECMGKDKLSGYLSMELDVYPPDRRRRDLDNLLKATLDALQHARIYDDDNQICDLRIRRRDVVKGGLMKITLQEVVPVLTTAMTTRALPANCRTRSPKSVLNGKRTVITMYRRLKEATKQNED